MAKRKMNSQSRNAFKFRSSQRLSVIDCSFRALNFAPAWDYALKTICPISLNCDGCLVHSTFEFASTGSLLF